MGNLEGYYTEGVAELVLELLPDGNTCIDVGAYDFGWLSNSYLLELDGWEVFCIEPNPHCKEMLSKRKNVYDYAIGAENKDDVDFYIIRVGHGPNGEAGGSGLIRFKFPEEIITTVKVKLRTLDWFIENETDIDHLDFLSIDTEGTELDVLRGIDLDRWNVKVIAAENLYGVDNPQGKSLEQINYLIDRGFVMVDRLIFNDIFVRE